MYDSGFLVALEYPIRIKSEPKSHGVLGSVVTREYMVPEGYNTPTVTLLFIYNAYVSNEKTSRKSNQASLVSILMSAMVVVLSLDLERCREWLISPDHVSHYSSIKASAKQNGLLNASFLSILYPTVHITNIPDFLCWSLSPLPALHATIVTTCVNLVLLHDEGHSARPPQLLGPLKPVSVIYPHFLSSFFDFRRTSSRLHTIKG